MLLPVLTLLSNHIQPHYSKDAAVIVHAVRLFVLEVPLAATTTTSGLQLVNIIAGCHHNSRFITL